MQQSLGSPGHFEGMVGILGSFNLNCKNITQTFFSPHGSSYPFVVEKRENSAKGKLEGSFAKHYGYC